MCCQVKAPSHSYKTCGGKHEASRFEPSARRTSLLLHGRIGEESRARPAKNQRNMAAARRRSNGAMLWPLTSVYVACAAYLSACLPACLLACRLCTPACLCTCYALAIYVRYACLCTLAVYVRAMLWPLPSMYACLLACLPFVFDMVPFLPACLPAYISKIDTTSLYLLLPQLNPCICRCVVSLLALVAGWLL